MELGELCGGGVFWGGVCFTVESVRVRFTFMGISIRTSVPKRSILQKRLEERQSAGEMERSPVELLLPHSYWSFLKTSRHAKNTGKKGVIAYSRGERWGCVWGGFTRPGVPV